MLKGSLDDFAVEDVLWLIARTKRTGKLAIQRPGTRAALFFRDGLLYLAQNDAAAEPLESHLVRTGLITTQQLEEARRRRPAGSSTLRALLTSGSLDRAELHAAAEARMTDVVFDAMRGGIGEFAWEAGAKAEPDVDTPVRVQQILDLAGARLSRLEEIESAIPSDLAVPSYAAAPRLDGPPITVTNDQWRLLARVDGTKTIREICTDTGLTGFTALAAFHDLVTRGLIEIAPPAASSTARIPPPPPPPRPVAARVFKIVLLCTANRIRSPLGQALFTRGAGDLPVAVTSYGVGARDGERVVGEAATAGRELGIELSDHRSRALRRGALADADLVLAFEARHARRAIRDGGATPARTFTLREFVRCAERIGTVPARDPVSRATAVVERADRLRAERGAKDRDIDIVDPLGGPPSAYRNTALRVRELSERALRALFGDASD